MPASAMAASMASAPIVKFRLTGSLPAASTAMLARAPPTLAGRSTPTAFWSRGARRDAPGEQS